MKSLLSKYINFRFVFILPLSILLIGAIFTYYVNVSYQVENKEKIKQAAAKELAALSDEINKNLALYNQALSSLNAAIMMAGIDNFNYQNYLEYFNSLPFQKHYLGAHGFGFIEKVEAQKLDQFITKTQSERPDGSFNIHSLSEPKDIHFIIKYIEPELQNQQALGLDIASEANRFQAAMQAAHTHSTTFTGPITLVQANNKIKHGFLLLHPVFYPQKNKQDIAQLYGWVYAPIMINEVLSVINIAYDSFNIDITDITRGEKVEFYSSEEKTNVNVTVNKALEEQGYVQNQTLEVYGRTWQIEMTPTESFINSLNLVKLSDVLLLGAAFTFIASSLLTFLIVVSLKRAKEIKRKVELAAIFENTQEAIIALEQGFTITHWNSAARRLLNLTEQAFHRPIVDWLTIVLPNDKLLKILKELKEKQQEYLVETQLTHQVNNHECYISLSFMPIVVNKEFLGVILTINDVTELKKLQLNLKEKNENLKQEVNAQTHEIENKASLQNAILAASSSAIIATDNCGVIKLFNHSAEKLLQFAAEEVIENNNIIDFLSEHILVNLDLKSTNAVDSFATLVQQLKTQVSTLLFTKNKQTVVSNLGICNIYNEDDSIFGYVFTLHDITQIKLLEKEYQLTLASVTNSQDVLFWTTMSGQIVNANPYAAAALDYELNQLKQQNIQEIISFPPENNWSAMLATMDTSCRFSFAGDYLQQDGSAIPMLITLCKLTVENETLLYFSAKNITELVEKEFALKHALLQADKANESKVHFLSNISHELRTPLNVINGVLQLLTLSPLEPQQMSNIEHAKNNVKILQHCIDDILDLTDIENGELTLLKKDFNFHDLLCELGTVLSSLADDKEIEIHYTIADDIPFNIFADEKRLKQILLNIAGNAVKFTEQGEVIIRLEVAEMFNDKFMLKVTVEDTGIGIKEDKLAKIFDLFNQADDTNQRRYNGVGIGLSISSRLVNLMAGKIHVTSTFGIGSTFTIDVLLEKSPNQLLHIEPKLLGKPLNILLVDDNKTSLAILSQTVKQLCWTVTSCQNAEEAMQNIQTAIDTENLYDVILVDWNMPDIDGWQLSEQIKQHFAEQNIPLIIMVTAYSRKLLANKRLEKANVLDGFVTKPITKFNLLDAVTDALNSLDNEKIKQQALQQLYLIDKRILVVEDNPTNQYIAKELLQSQGAEVVVASGGQQCLDELNNALLPFDIVLMDIQMPDMDGYETTKKIREQEQFTELPILAMTANVLNTDKVKCLVAGMNGHIGKPFELSELVENILQLTSSLNTTELINLIGMPSQQFIEPELLTFAKENNININDLFNRFIFNKKLISLTIRLYFDDLLTYQAYLKNTTTIKADKLKTIFHTVKGTSASLGFNELCLLSKDMEQQAINEDIKVEQLDLANYSLTLDKTILIVDKLIEIIAQLPDYSEHHISQSEGESVQTMLQQLAEEIDSFNMQALDTFNKIRVDLKNISSDDTDALANFLNVLNFKDAMPIVCHLLKKM